MEKSRTLTLDPRPTDGELLERFCARRDHSAFAQLLQRHGPMILSVCRRVLGNYHDAEDAFQAAFIVLVRRAGSIRKRDSLASWLHGVAYRTARAALRDSIRRRQLSTANEPRAPGEAKDYAAEVQEIVDEELERLPEKYRAPVVLCYLQGKSKPEAAEILGWPEGTVSGRLARARAMLRARLARRGMTVSDGAVSAALIGTVGSPAVSEALTTSVLRIALAVSGTAAGRAAIPGSVVQLAEGVLQGMTLSRLKTAALIGLAITIIATGSAFGLHALAARDTPAKPPAQAQVPSDAPVNGTSGKPNPPEAPPALKEPERWTELAQLKGHNDQVFVAVFDADGKQLATGDLKGKIIVWNVATGKEIRKLGGHKGRVTAMAFAPDGKSLLSIGGYGVVKRWDLEKGTELSSTPLPIKNLSQAAFLPDGKSVLTTYSVFDSGDRDTSKDGEIQLWDLKSAKALETFKAHEFMSFGKMFLVGDGKRLVTMGTEMKTIQRGGGFSSGTVHVIKVWDTAKWKPTAKWELEVNGPFGASPDGRWIAVRLATLRGNSFVQVFDTTKNKVAQRLPVGKAAFTIDAGLGFSPDSKVLATPEGKNIRFWDAETGKSIAVMKGNAKDVSQCVFSPDATRLVAISGGTPTLLGPPAATDKR